jgi:uncharacterized Ntn-hydrolase superfamily protein
MLPRRITLRSLLLLGMALTFTASARATWSVVVVNNRTREVCVASATCLGGTNLRRLLPVIVVGQGAGAAQSSIDSSGANRIRMFNGIVAGATADQIMQDLIDNGSGPHQRQYGIASLNGTSASYSGEAVGHAKGDLFTTVGDLSYAIQGNVLTGPVVVWRAEQALLETEGDLGQKVMAAMEAARAMGGDGRCSCLPAQPEKCGAPPDEFTKSAHTAFIVVARLGDVDGVCNGDIGCANGQYYLTLDEIGNGTTPDPILVLQRKFDRWRAFMSGVPDHLLTTVVPGTNHLPADGVSSTQVVVDLRDLDDVPVTHGGQSLIVTYTGDMPAAATAGVVTDHGDGTHSFDVTATTDAGQASWRIVVDMGLHKVQLYPELAIEVAP